jgi:hypothetical protein
MTHGMLARNSSYINRRGLSNGEGESDDVLIIINTQFFHFQFSFHFL